jgi:DHA3 family tetracycline resistance protein-like MFS transporter
VRKLGAYPVYLVLSGASTLFNETMFTALTVYYVVDVGLSPLQLVLVGTALEIATFLFEVPTGVIADTFSRRLSVIIGMCITGAAFVLVGVVPLFGAVLLGNVIWGIGSTFISGAREAWIAGEVGEKELGRVFVRTAQVRQVAALAGTFVSVGLASLWLGLPLIIGGCLTIALGVFLAFAMPEVGFAPTPRGERTTWQALGRTLSDSAQAVRRSPLLLTVAGVSIFAGASSEGFDRLGDAHLLANFHFPTLGTFAPVVWFGIINAGARILSLAATELFRGRIDRLSHHVAATTRTLFVIQALIAASVIGFGLAGSFMLALTAYWTRAVIGALGSPLYDAWLAQRVAPKLRATVYSMLNQADALGQSAGGPAIGAIGSYISLRAAIVATGIMLAPAAALYARASRSGSAEPADAQPA